MIFRRTYPELEELIDRSQTLIPSTWPGSEWFKSEKTWHFPTGAMLRMRSLEQAEDVAKYWGHSYSWIGFDELGAWPDDRAYKQLIACLRSALPVEAVRIRATANPGGSGHQWVRARFIDPAPKGYVPITDIDTNMTRVFVPSRVQDNRILMVRDPGYVDRLKGVGSPELVRAWLEGDWNLVVGAYFPEFSINKHVVEPVELPMYWTRFRAYDHGSARPFSVGWWAVSGGELPRFPRGALICYREWYGCRRDANGNSIPNTGLRLTAEEIADGIAERERNDLTERRKQMSGVADPSIFAQDSGPSIRDRMAARGVYWNPADNTRVPKLGAMGGWDHVRSRLKGDGERPAIFWFSTCRDTIRTLPALQHDQGRPEDVADGEDHAGDQVRYSCASRPYLAPLPPEAPPPPDRYRRSWRRRRAHEGSGWAA